ncbi:hypothetical protein IX317_001119 [Fusobacterium sp. DD29]|nr:hypothetical protein [Fusobacterium sp. DD45]MBR8711067.1 hypothetical protein [Fusobacterium sp. DD28]MBR8749445.1 hypothetical protein [Fusobacterium sp. DD29]MBR8751641.1 hypothetical protein [Fusobacterium sp. DD26]MBR8761665.1 hypothetical protein [Fusobacterium sp. DD25]MBR8767705.1 hypothetical protein [Fusobacterium sp. DD43]MBR8771747.1 hypothetical protein [Fusobacterium sp. DD40]MBR8775981.1 hypothetical protein [Fusobacterium sp. DD17]MBR8798243.1 hypothetical protein [Fusoba
MIQMIISCLITYIVADVIREKKGVYLNFFQLYLMLIVIFLIIKFGVMSW